MALMTIEVPDEVLGIGADAPWSLAHWDGAGVPDAVVLNWVDTLPVGPWSLALLARIDESTLAAEERPVYLRAWQRVESLAAARQLGAVAAIGTDPPRGTGAIDPAAHEVGVALRMPVGSAQHEVFLARRLTRMLPATRALADAGLLTRRHVREIVHATTVLSAEQCAEVEARVLKHGPDQSVGQFTRAVRRAVAAVDTRGFDARHEAKAADSDVTVETDDDAMAWLTARMPLVDALIVKKAVDHFALSRKKAGDPRPIGVLRADALRTFAERYLTDDRPPTHHGRPVEVQVVATAEALAGLADTPGEIAGVGPVPIEVIREMAGQARLRWLTISGRDGRLLDRDPRTRRIPAELHAVSDTTYVTSVGPFSTVLAERCDTDHLTRHPDGPTAADNLAPVDRPWHLGKTHLDGMTATRSVDGAITWRTPLGQAVTVHPYDYRLGP